MCLGRALVLLLCGPVAKQPFFCLLVFVHPFTPRVGRRADRGPSPVEPTAGRLGGRRDGPRSRRSWRSLTVRGCGVCVRWPTRCPQPGPVPPPSHTWGAGVCGSREGGASSRPRDYPLPPRARSIHYLRGLGFGTCIGGPLSCLVLRVAYHGPCAACVFSCVRMGRCKRRLAREEEGIVLPFSH
jgi:hypothetical protein